MQMEPMELQHAVFETDGGRIDAMWSDVRLHAGDIPDGWHCYAVRGGDGGLDWQRRVGQFFRGRVLVV